MRVIFPPFQHKAGVTEIDHALDAKALDEAFSELANALNGGLDESNLSAGVKFSTLSPGAPSVNTALADKYSVVTMSVSGSWGNAAGINVPIGTVIGSGWLPWHARFIFSRSATSAGIGLLSVNAYDGATAKDIKNLAVVDRRIQGSTYYEYVSCSLENTTANADRIFVGVTSGTPVYYLRHASVSFLVPVL